MGLFGSIGKALGGLGQMAGLIPGVGTVAGGVLGGLGGLAGGGGLGGALKGALGGALPGLGGLASKFLGSGAGGAVTGAVGSLLGGGGNQGALLGGLGGLAGGQAGMDPAMIALLSQVGGGVMGEQKAAREAAEQAAAQRNALLERNLGLAEQTFAQQAPVRDLGLGAMRNFFAGGGGPSRGLFQTPTTAGSLTPPEVQTPAFVGASAPQAGSQLFPGLGGLDNRPPAPAPGPAAAAPPAPAPAGPKRPPARRPSGGGSQRRDSGRDRF